MIVPRAMAALSLSLAVLLLAALWCPPLSAREVAPLHRRIIQQTPAPSAAREDTARLVFQKTAGERRETREYVVKKGEWITGIFRAQLGDEPVPYDRIRQLNPRIRDLNLIQPGQRIVLPIRRLLDPQEPVGKESEPARAIYSVKEGDSVSRIIITELNTPPEEALKTYRLLRRLNPGIRDLSHLQVGQVLNLPREHGYPLPPPSASAMAQEPAPMAASASESVPAGTPPFAQAPVMEETLTAAPLRLPPSAELLLGFIGPVIGRMKGSLTALGSYFIPLKEETAQIAIDCSLIPVVELADGSAVLLDFGNRLSERLKGMIRQSWTNYAFVPGDELLDSLSGLQGIIRHSRNYMMFKLDRPLAVTPQIMAYPDWVIAEKKSTGDRPYRQGLFLMGREEKTLPLEARTVLEKSGLVVMEIANGQAVDPPPAAAPAQPQSTTDLRGLKGIALAEQLLKALGESPVAAAEIAVFDQTRDGFNLSVTADLLLQRGEKRFILHTKRLPEEFSRIFKQGGTETLLIGPAEGGRPLIERVLQGIHIPFTAGHFSFRIPEDSNRPRLTTAFPALRVTVGGEPLYLIDFDMSPDLRSLLHSRRSGTIVPY